jgi:hypothetical protein
MKIQTDATNNSSIPPQDILGLELIPIELFEKSYLSEKKQLQYAD